MYKVMLVDDETVNYQLFEKLVDWKGKGFEIAAVAADGLEALQKYDEVKPDIIFMDIRLPFMDGLECIRYIREEDEKVRIVIVSAYGDFSYAQKAIQYGVQDFLLKPVSRLMLNQLVDKMKSYLENEKVLLEDADWREKQIKYLRRLCYEEPSPQAQGPDLRQTALCGLMVTDREGGRIPEENRNTLFEKMWESPEIKKYSFLTYSPNSIHTIGVWKRGEGQETLVKTLQRLVEEEGYICQAYLFEDQTQGIHEWIKKFICIENYGFYELKSGIYHMEESPFLQEEIQTEGLNQIVAKSVVSGSCTELTDMFERLFQSAADKKIHPGILKDAALDCLVRIKFVLKKFDQQGSFLLMRNIRIENIHNIQSVKKLKLFIMEKIQETFGEIKEYIGVPGRKLVFRANAYTEISYQEKDFSVQKVADHIGISKNYFTSQYKELTGGGFWEYVTRLRMEKAKELLIMTDKMIGTIACDVGYESEYHFSRKFKEYTGQSPKNFRNSVEKSK